MCNENRERLAMRTVSRRSENRDGRAFGSVGAGFGVIHYPCIIYVAVSAGT